VRLPGVQKVIDGVTYTVAVLPMPEGRTVTAAIES
jgi:hypothetical protein